MAKRLLNLGTQEHEWVLSEAEYAQLVERDDFLTALEGAGVDNWEGYSEAFRVIAGEEEEW